MRIQAINPVSNGVQNNNKNTAFNGIWMRMGQDVLNPEMYSYGVFYKFINGIENQHFVDSRTGRRLRNFGSVNMTVEDGKNAYAFLFEKIRNSKGYEAVKKLKAFMQSMTTRDDVHNVMFLEKEDYADVTKERQRLSLVDVNKKLLDYEKENVIIKTESESAKYDLSKPPSMDEFHDMITKFGVA